MNPAEIASKLNSLTLNTSSGGAAKTSSNIEFSTRLKNGVGKGAGLAYQTIAPVTPFVPGGAIMSAMLNNATTALANNGGSIPQYSGGMGLGGMGGTGGMMGLGQIGMNQTVGAPGNGGLFQSMEQLQENMMSMNVYMLGLQQGFNDMNQKYTAISNVLKTKHETEKNAISNFR